MTTKILTLLGLAAFLGCSDYRDAEAREYAEELPNLPNCNDGDSAVLTIKDIGWSVYIKEAGFTYGTGKFSAEQGETTWNRTNTVYLPKSWHDATDKGKARVGCHELTHVLQFSRRTVRLASKEPAFSIVFELEAAVSGYIATVKSGAEPEQAVRRAHRFVDTWPEHTTAGDFNDWPEWSELSKDILSERIWDTYYSSGT